MLSFSLGLTQDFNGGADMGCVRSDHMDLVRSLFFCCCLGYMFFQFGIVVCSLLFVV